jgi:hypothetical protein
MNFIKNLALACAYVAEGIESNPALKNEFQQTSARLLVIAKNYKPTIKDILDREVAYTLDLVELGVVDGSVGSVNADIFRQGVAKVKTQLQDRTVTKISLSHYFNGFKEEQLIDQLPTITPDVATLTESPTPISTEDGELTSRDRKQIILAALSRQASGLKELRELIPNTNDKTLQRDLNDLIRDRKIIRLGEKRWAKYYLK